MCPPARPDNLTPPLHTPPQDRRSYSRQGQQQQQQISNMRNGGRTSEGAASSKAALCAAAAVGGAALTMGVAYLWPQLIEEYAGVKIVVKKTGGSSSKSNKSSSGGHDGGSNDVISPALREVIQREVDHQVYERVCAMNKAQQAAGGGKKLFPPTAILSESQRMRVLVTGGAGFVGSHLVDRLMEEGHEVIVLDNMFTGRKKNVAHWIGHPNFMLIVHDVVEPIMLEVDQIYHLACPASPPHYQYNPIKTIKTSTMGTLNMLGLAKRVRARMLLTSTSEVYGDPQIHPQPESYWGNVNPIGPRACYDEGKRVAETMMYAYHNQGNVDVRVARIFNTFGPRMHPNDGRVVSNFIIQALQGKDITIYGEGQQTRSFQYVEDLVSGLIKLMNSDYGLPCNLGNPEEYTVKDFAILVKELVTGSSSTIIHMPATKDDPAKRKPDITIAREVLDWQPRVPVREGLSKTVAYFRAELEETGEIVPTGPDAQRPKPCCTGNLSPSRKYEEHLHAETAELAAEESLY